MESSCQEWLLLVSPGQTKQASELADSASGLKDVDMMKWAASELLGAFALKALGMRQ